MEEEIKVLEKFVETGKYNIKVIERDMEKGFEWTDPTEYKKLIYAVQHIIDGYRRLEKDNKHLLIQGAKQVADTDINYIPKSKIKEKIAELEKRKKYLLDANLKDIGTMIGCEDCDEKIELYKELLEEKEETNDTDS